MCQNYLGLRYWIQNIYIRCREMVPILFGMVSRDVPKGLQRLPTYFRMIFRQVSILSSQRINLPAIALSPILGHRFSGVRGGLWRWQGLCHLDHVHPPRVAKRSRALRNSKGWDSVHSRSSHNASETVTAPRECRRITWIRKVRGDLSNLGFPERWHDKIQLSQCEAQVGPLARCWCNISGENVSTRYHDSPLSDEKNKQETVGNH